jgi:uncharacterized protein DUF1345
MASRLAPVVMSVVGALAALVAEVALFVLGLAIVFPSGDDIDQQALLLWSAIALAYLIGGGLLARRHRDDDDAGQAVGLPLWERSRVGGWFRALSPILTSMVGLGASLSVLLSGDLPEADQGAIVALCALTMLLAWLILHVGYARRYRRDYHQLGGRGLVFPDTPTPQLVDFLYFAVTLGTTFATSDVNITSRSVRWTVTIHSVLGFLYNAVVLAVAFKVITG